MPRISDVTCVWLQAPIPPERRHTSDFGRMDTFNTGLVTIRTDDGLTGYGEAVRLIAKHVYEEDGVDRCYIMHIRYDDQYRRVGDGWRIAHRHLTLLWDEDHPLRT